MPSRHRRSQSPLKRLRPRGLRGAGAERGAVLFVGLIILAIMTIAGLSAMRGTALEERMAGNLKDQTDAFQGAEAALQAALTFIKGSSQAPGNAPYGARGAIGAGCNVANANSVTSCTLSADLSPGWLSVADTFPTDGSAFFDYANTRFGPAASASEETGAAWGQPRIFVVSRYVPDLEFTAAGEQRGIHFFTVSAVAAGRSGESRVVLQTTIAKVFAW